MEKDKTKTPKKKSMKFNCEKCGFHSNVKMNYERHLQTNKHKMEKDNVKNHLKKRKKYICEFCCYYSNNKRDYEKHLQTNKHNINKMVKNGNKMVKNGNKKKHECICGKSYTYLQGLCRHKNICEQIVKSHQIISNKNVQFDEFIDKHSDKNIIINVNNNYYDNKVMNSNNIQNNTDNSTNNSFSVKNYLNNECKDALTVKQVLDNFQCDIMKLPSKPIPFYKNIVDKAFQNIPTNKLPIRCSDVKRKTFYGHAEDWNKDFNVVKEFIKKLVDAICEFRKMFVNNNPKWVENDITSDIMGSIIINIAKVYDEHTVKKIIQYISERTKIDK